MKLEDLGYNVPEHISVLGFDNIDFSRHFEPELSTINQDTKMIAETAAIRLLDMMDHPSEKTQVIEKINVKLIERKSTRTRK